MSHVLSCLSTNADTDTIDKRIKQQTISLQTLLLLEYIKFICVMGTV